MKLHNIDNRELRSFKLHHKVLHLRTFFQEENSFGLFMMNDLLQPEDRIAKRKTYIDHNITVKNISKKMGRYLTADSKWNPVHNLLKGSVVFIQDKKGAVMSPATINFLIKNERYSLRFVYWKHNIHRFKDLEKVLHLSDLTNNNIISPLSLLKKTIFLPWSIINNLTVKN